MKPFILKTITFTGKCLIASSIGASLGLIAYLIAKDVTLSENFRISKEIREEFLSIEEKPIKVLDWRNK